jgi:VanZ family protein
MRSVFFHKPDSHALDAQHRAWGALWLVNVWLPAAIAVACVATESTPGFSSEHTNSWLRPIVEHLFGAIPDAVWKELHHLFRKSGHVLGYGLVCLTFLRAWLLTLGTRVSLNVERWRLRSCIAAILSTAIVASGDEIHQTFLPSRTGQFSDVVLDTCGATLICLVMWWVCWRRPAQTLR